MKARLANLFWLVALLLVVIGIIYAALPSRRDAAAQKAVQDTRLALRQQGFKTDLADFDFATSPELRAREAILKAIATSRASDSPADQLNLMEVVGNNSAIVVWQQPTVKKQYPSWPDNSDEMTWDDFRDAMNQNRSVLDAASGAILSGPIQFNLNASGGAAMLLPHLAVLKNLTQTLGSRMELALHDSDQDAAWTNLLAATRLVTAWNPEPAEVSHLVRFVDTKLVFDETWQALHTNNWPDEKLARLQAEWEAANFLTNLPEVVAFTRASRIAAYDYDRNEATQPPMSFKEFFIASLQFPQALWSEYRSRWSQGKYFRGGIYEEEKDVLLFYRDREVEQRNAVQAPTWMQMRQLPGVTHEVFFQSKYQSRVQAMMNIRRISMGFQRQGSSFLGRAAEAEAERRILITAIALERYRGKFGSYPNSLASLTPEFLKARLPDFMDGQPLRYRPTADGHFLLYSVGLDCVDDGGQIPVPLRPNPAGIPRELRNVPPKGDIVWPLPASSAQVVTLRKEQSQAETEREAQLKTQMETQMKADEQRAEEARQAAMKKLLAEKPSLGEEPVYQGKPLSSWVIKVGQIEMYNGAPKDAVAAIRAIGSNAVPFLLEWMPHPGAERPVDGFPDWSDVDIAWWALGTEGKSAIPTLAHIINLPRHKMNDYSVWTESAKAISYLGPDAIIPMLTVATNMAGQHELWELLHNFENLGTNGAPAVPALIHWANDSDYWVRDGVVSALGGIGERPDLAVPVLTNALEHDANSMVRRDAAEALGAFANDSDAVLHELIKALKGPDWQARGGALSGLGKIQNKPEVVVPLIAPFLYDDNNVIQRTAAYALRDLGSEAGYRALLQASNAPSSWPGIGDIVYEVREKTNRNQSQ
jgi:HEAT repeats